MLRSGPRGAWTRARIADMALEKTLRNIALTAVFAVPFVVLIIASGFFFPFITGKNFAFRILVEIAVGAWLPLALIYAHYRPRRSWLLGVFALFVLALGISDIFGVNPAKSIWSNFERMEGWVTLAHLFAYFVVATSILNTEKLWRAFWHTTLIVSVIVALRGLLQLAGFLTINQGGVRLDSFLGNATYLAVYMLFHIFIAALFLARAWIERSRERVVATMFYGSIIAINSIVLFFTATRGAMLGLIGGALLAAALYILEEGIRSPRAKRVGVAMLALVALVLGTWLLKDTALVQGVAPLARLTSISFSEASLSARFMNIGMAWEGFKERPILGWGQENYAVVFDKHYNPNMYMSEPWFDRVHNVLFDWLIAGGIIGLLLYLALYAAALRMLWRGSAFSHVEKSILTGLLAGYAFYLMFTFDNITSYILFISILAWIQVRASAHSSYLAIAALPKGTLPILALLAVLGTWGVAYVVNAHAISANRAILAGLSASSPEESRDAFLRAASYGAPGSQEAREHFVQSAVALRGANIPEEAKVSYARFAAEEMTKQIEEAPLNARFPLFFGSLLNAYGQFDEAQAALLHARELSPGKQAIIFELGRGALAQGKGGDALAFFKEAYDLAPEYTEARVLYASTAILLGQHALGDEIAAPLVEGGTLDNRLAGAYASAKRYNKIIELWRAHLEKHPENVQGHFTLALAYYASGNVEKGIEVLELIEKNFPAAAEEAKRGKEQMRAGTLQFE